MKSNFITRLSVLGVALLGLSAGTAAAQNRPQQDRNPEQFVERRVERLDKQLDLTDAQEAQVRGLFEKQAQDLKQHFADAKAQREANRDFMRTQAEQMDQALIALLTPDQQKKYDELKTQRKARFEDRRNDRRDRGDRAAHRGQMRGQFQRYARELDLTDQQQDQIKQIMAEARQQMQTWHKDHADASREDRRAFMQSQMQQLNARVESVLTPEQVQKYHALRDQMKQNWQNRSHKGGDHQNHGRAQGAPHGHQ